MAFCAKAAGAKAVRASIKTDNPNNRFFMIELSLFKIV
jgi:hypothetical protein